MKKRVLSILLCIAVLFSSAQMFAFSASAASVSSSLTEKCDCGYDPIIYIHGFGNPLYMNYGAENEKEIWVPEKDVLMNGIKKLVPKFFKFMFTRDYRAFALAVKDFAFDLLTPIMCDDNGDSILDGISAAYTEPTGDHPKNTVKIYYYDWRLDVYDNADMLRDFINKVKAATGHDKVALDSESMATSITVSYLLKYGYDDVSALIFRSGAWNGISFMGEALSGRMTSCPESLTGYLQDFVMGREAKNVFFRFLIGSVGQVVIAPLSRLIDNLFKKAPDILYDDCLLKIYGNMPGVWSFVPDEDYESAKKFALDENKNAVLIEKIDRYHNEVRPKIKEIVSNAMSKNINVAIISNYGMYGVPATENYTYQSDFMVDTKFSSCGATCSELNKPLPEGYVQKVDDGHNHMSPDLQIDASTCMFPEYTWFVKGMIHTFFNDGYREMTYKIIYADHQMNVFEDEKYPQFMVNDDKHKTIVPMTADNSELLTKAELLKIRKSR